jgi:hypothetical protein
VRRLVDGRSQSLFAQAVTSSAESRDLPVKLD